MILVFIQPSTCPIHIHLLYGQAKTVGQIAAGGIRNAARIRAHHRIPTAAEQSLWGIDLLNVPKSDIPAATHVDYSARVQTVQADTNPRYHKLIKAFEAKTGCGLLVNTSFNVRSEPIVCSPEDAYRCFMRTAIDILVLENCILHKEQQKALENDTNWQQEFELD